MVFCAEEDPNLHLLQILGPLLEGENSVRRVLLDVVTDDLLVSCFWGLLGNKGGLLVWLLVAVAALVVVMEELML